MLLTTAAQLVALALSVAGGVNAAPLDASAQCGQLTNYVTVPGPTVTHFIEVEHNRASHNNGVTALGPADNTQTKANGPYMFTEHEGSTVWLGAAPPASITNFIKQTSVIVITPVPSPTATYTSYRTHTSIVTVFPTSAQYTPPSYGASSSNVPSGIFSSTIDTTIHMTQVTTILETLTSTHEGVPTTGWNISTTTSSEDSGYGPGSSVGTVSHLSSWSDVSGSSVYATLTFVVSSSTSVVTLPVGPSGDLSSSQASGTGGSSASRFSTSGLSILPYPTKSWIGTGQSSSSFPTSVMSIAPYPAPTWVTFSSRHGTESSSAPHNSQVEISSHSSSSFPISTTSMIPIPVPTWLTVSSYDDTSSSADTSSPSTSPSFILAPISTSYISAGNSTSTSYAEQSTGTSYLASSSSTLQAVPSATPSSCGEVGDFSITWDDLPVWTPSNNSSGGIFPPVFSPYHHLFHANGYGYTKEAWAKYEASSEPDIAIFIPALASVVSSSTGKIKSGEIGAGPRMSDPAHWFNAYNVSVGCDNQGPKNCLMTISAYTYDSEMKDEVLSGQQYVTVPACTETSGCQLTQVTFPEEFRNLSGIQFEAVVQTPKKSIFMLDTLSMGWSDNSGAAGLKRISIRS